MSFYLNGDMEIDHLEWSPDELFPPGDRYEEAGLPQGLPKVWNHDLTLFSPRGVPFDNGPEQNWAYHSTKLGKERAAKR